MKILHTSDWHVGRSIRGRTRMPEFEAVLKEIVEIARTEAVDLAIVAGDLFDTAAPVPEAERLVYRTLLDLANTGATVAVLSGNHDNERRLAAVEPLLGLGRIVARPYFAPPAEGGVHAFETKAGEPVKLAMIPFLSQRYIVKVTELMEKDAGEHQSQYAARMREIVKLMCSGFGDDSVNIVAAHLAVAGADLGGGERESQTFFDYFVPPTVFPANTSYVALGHIHKAQQIHGACPIWYCGSPLFLDFPRKADEAIRDRHVLLVEASPGRPARIEQRPLRAGRRLRNLRGTVEDLGGWVGKTGDDYLRVFVHEDARAGIAQEIREQFPDAVDVRIESGPAEAEEKPRRAGRSPHELFVEYLTEHNATDERVIALFDQLLDEAHASDPA